MKQHYYYFLISGFLCFSCNETKQSDLPEIPVDIEQKTSLPLSEIAETITAIELELTDESPIKPGRNQIKRINVSDDLVFLAQNEKILVFNTNGKFARSIGSRGQGPGEYRNIRNFTIDETNKRLFVNAHQKIICYDFDGNVLAESSVFRLNTDGLMIDIIDINYTNNELLIIGFVMGREDAKGLFNYSAVYRLNEELQITDSCTIRNIYERPHAGFSTTEDYILIPDSTVYLYYPYTLNINYYPSSQTVLRDTLYRFEQKHLVPELKLKFKNDGIDGGGNLYISLYNVYRSSRYIFAEYANFLGAPPVISYVFCYDTKTGKGYNIRDGYTDDIHQIDQVKIRPFNTNPEMFYYWHTHMKPDDLEEPNPTLYIGTLKN